MTNAVAEWVETECTRLEAKCLAGDYRAAAECLDICTANRHPLPEWLVPVIRQAMAFTAHRLNADGAKQGKTGSYAKQWQRADIRRERHAAAARALKMLENGELAAHIGKKKASKGDAYEWAANWLRLVGSNAVGDADRIRRDYGDENRRQLAGIKDKEVRD